MINYLHHLKQHLLLLTIITSFILSISLTSQTAYAIEEVASGTCGNNITWTFDNEGILSFQGEGEIPDYKPSKRPWNTYIIDVQKIIVNEGITRIGDCAFYQDLNLIEISLPKSLTSIGKSAFAYCNALQHVTLPDNVTSVDPYAFDYCRGLESVNLPNNLTILR